MRVASIEPSITKPNTWRVTLTCGHVVLVETIHRPKRSIVACEPCLTIAIRAGQGRASANDDVIRHQVDGRFSKGVP